MSGALALASLCFIPGMGGMTKAVEPRGPIAASLESRRESIPFVAFDLGKNGSVENRAERLVANIEAQLNSDANFKCHFVAHSLGGVVARYAIANLKVHHPTRGLIPITEVAQSLTTIGTPHHGTPLGALARFAIPWNKGLGQMRRKSVERYANAKDKKHYSPMTEDFRAYSYRLRPDGSVKCGRWMERLGLAFARKIFPKQLAPGFSDFISNTKSQGFGVGLGDLKICHSYFDHDYPIQPTPADFYEMHAYRVNHQMPLYRQRQPELWKKFREMGVWEASERDVPASQAGAGGH